MLNNSVNMRTFREFIEQEISDAEVANLYLHHRFRKVEEIAKETGRSIPEVYRILRKFSLEPNRTNSNIRD